MYDERPNDTAFTEWITLLGSHLLVCVVSSGTCGQHETSLQSPYLAVIAWRSPSTESMGLSGAHIFAIRAATWPIHEPCCLECCRVCKLYADTAAIYLATGSYSSAVAVLSNGKYEVLDWCLSVSWLDRVISAPKAPRLFLRYLPVPQEGYCQSREWLNLPTTAPAFLRGPEKDFLLRNLRCLFLILFGLFKI